MNLDLKFRFGHIHLFEELAVVLFRFDQFFLDRFKLSIDIFWLDRDLQQFQVPFDEREIDEHANDLWPRFFPLFRRNRLQCALDRRFHVLLL